MFLAGGDRNKSDFFFISVFSPGGRMKGVRGGSLLTKRNEPRRGKITQRGVAIIPPEWKWIKRKK